MLLRGNAVDDQLCRGEGAPEPRIAEDEVLLVGHRGNVVAVGSMDDETDRVGRRRVREGQERRLEVPMFPDRPIQARVEPDDQRVGVACVGNGRGRVKEFPRHGVVDVGERHRLCVRAGCCQQQGGHHGHRLGFALGHVCVVPVSSSSRLRDLLCLHIRADAHRGSPVRRNNSQHSRLICPIVSAPGCMPSSVARTPMRTPRRRAACATIWRGVRERISPRRPERA